MLLPKEHGVYAQMACPLITALSVTGLRASSVLLAVAIVAGFVLHEPLLVVLGKRGRPAQQKYGVRAWRWLIGLACAFVVAGGLAFVGMPGRTPWWLLLPAVPAGVVFVSAWRGTERQWVAQIGVALAFSLTVVPICASAGVPLAVSGAIAAVFAVTFVLGSLAVRVVVLRVRGGGDQKASPAARRSVFAVAFAATMATAGFVVAGGVLPLPATLALVTGIGLPVQLAYFPPATSQLRRVGWTLVASSTVVTALLIAGYRGF